MPEPASSRSVKCKGPGAGIRKLARADFCAHQPMLGVCRGGEEIVADLVRDGASQYHTEPYCAPCGRSSSSTRLPDAATTRSAPAIDAIARARWPVCGTSSPTVQTLALDLSASRRLMTRTRSDALGGPVVVAADQLRPTPSRRQIRSASEISTLRERIGRSGATEIKAARENSGGEAPSAARARSGSEVTSTATSTIAFRTIRPTTMGAIVHDPERYVYYVSSM